MPLKSFKRCAKSCNEALSCTLSKSVDNISQGVDNRRVRSSYEKQGWVRATVGPEDTEVRQRRRNSSAPMKDSGRPVRMGTSLYRQTRSPLNSETGLIGVSWNVCFTILLLKFSAISNPLLIPPHCWSASHPSLFLHPLPAPLVGHLHLVLMRQVQSHLLMNHHKRLLDRECGSMR